MTITTTTLSLAAANYYRYLGTATAKSGQPLPVCAALLPSVTSHLLLGSLAAPYRALAAPCGALRPPDVPQMVDIARIHLPPGVR